jgi:hypothetical protein
MQGIGVVADLRLAQADRLARLRAAQNTHADDSKLPHSVIAPASSTPVRLRSIEEASLPAIASLRGCSGARPSQRLIGSLHVY